MKKVAAAVALAACLAGCGSEPFPARELARPATPVFPAPPSGAVVFSRQHGADVLAVAVAPARRGKAVLVRVSVVGQQGHGVPGLAVHVRAGGPASRAPACGPGCYQMTLAAQQPRAVDVQLAGRVTGRWHVALPAAWPVPGASELVRRAERVWRKLRSVTVRDFLASDPQHSVSTTWRIVAPDRLEYHVDGRGSSVIIGRKRWDRARGGVWVASAQDPPLEQPVPFWVGAENAHVLGSAVAAGRPAWRVSFYDPKTPAWFEVLIDKRTAHTLDLRMNTTAHFMHERYSAFDAPIRIRPPRGG